MDKIESHTQSRGCLTIVGCGLHPGHMTKEAESTIKNAEIVLFLTPNPLSIHHIYDLNLNVENLGLLYEGDVTRREAYGMMSDRMVELVLQGRKVCCVFYGHPGVFVSSTHMAIDRLNEMGLPVKMLPGISAEACLFADLHLDPAISGCISYEVSQFLLTRKQLDTSAILILWQVGIVGEYTFNHHPGEDGLTVLTMNLTSHYPKDHPVCIYEAPTLPGFPSRADWINLKDLSEAVIKLVSTLVVPALSQLDSAEDSLNQLGFGKER